MPTNPFVAPTGTQPFTSRSAASGGDTLDDYLARKAANPSYVPTKSSDPVGWIVENWGEQWLKADGTAPDEAIWTYTGGENGAPKIGSVTGINYLPWNDKNLQYDPANGEDYSRPQFANGPDQLSTGGYKGTAAEIQADRDAHNVYRGGTGMDPAMLAGLQNASYVGVMRDQYNIPGYGMYGTAKSPFTGSYEAASGKLYRAAAGGQGSSGGPIGSVGAPAGGGTVPAAPPYIGVPPDFGKFGAGKPQVARGPWMQEMDSSGANMQQQALVAALRGST